MCGRFTLRAGGAELQRRFGLQEAPELRPRFNIAPTQEVAAVRQDEHGQRRVDLLRWGLVPSWARDPSIGARLINARAETAAEKPAFRHAFRRRRCLVPADGFYEWQRTQDGRGRPRKQPWLITVGAGEPFAMAGLWERWEAPERQVLETVTILTTAANELLQPVHDRMPVILPGEAYAGWLDTEEQDPSALAQLLTTYPAPDMRAVEVSTRVNRATFDDPACVQPLRGGR